MIDVIKETLTERASLSYWVSFANEHNNNEVEYNFYTSAFPIEFNNISPFVARISAISFVRLNPVVPTSDGKLQLRVYLMDNESGKNYPIYRGVEPSTDELPNLEAELMLYMDNGYPFFGWHLESDQLGNYYRVINTDDWLV